MLPEHLDSFTISTAVQTITTFFILYDPGDETFTTGCIQSRKFYERPASWAYNTRKMSTKSWHGLPEIL